ncbi:MAG: hypothetical protein ACLR5H_11025 [Oscillospiraceae bacterium]
MNSESEQRLSLQELKQRNHQQTALPVQAPPPEASPTKADWGRMMNDLDTLWYHADRQTDLLESVSEADVAASHTDAAGRSSEDGAASGADDQTGWEAERELFFSAQNQTSQTASATRQYSGIDLSADGGGSAASALVGLGHRLEQLQPAAPVMPIQHYTDRKVLQKEREKKIALGHKADDHEDEVSYDWQQTM